MCAQPESHTPEIADPPDLGEMAETVYMMERETNSSYRNPQIPNIFIKHAFQPHSEEVVKLNLGLLRKPRGKD